MAELSDKTKNLAETIGRLARGAFLRDLPHFIKELGGEKAVLKRLAGMDLEFHFQLLVAEIPVPGQEEADGLPPMNVLIEVEKEVLE